jgi:hypothetical protein
MLFCYLFERLHRFILKMHDTKKQQKKTTNVDQEAC